MSYQALYRSWRPQVFADLVGQPHVKQTLTNAILRKQVAHAYLFCGPRGTGKTSAAKILAKAVNCLSPHDAEPCNECSACQSITSGNNVDVEEIDAASNRGVDEIRQLRDKVQYAPTSLKRKVYIVDEVHMLTAEAFNALLKTLEEPPSHTLFVLATTEPHKIPATIISRCQRFDFHRISPDLIVERLQLICSEKNWQYEDEALWKIAEAADGGLRDALGLLEQTGAYGEGQLTAENAAHVVGGVQTSAILALVDALVKHELFVVMNLLMDWYSGGKNAARIVSEILRVIRDVLVVKLSKEAAKDITGKYEKYEEAAQACSTEWLLYAMKQMGETYMHMRFVEQPRLALESSLLSLASIGTPELSQPQAPIAPLAGAPAGHASAAHAIDELKRQVAEKPQADGPVRQSAEAEDVDAARAPLPAGAKDRAASPRIPKKTSAARKLEILQDLRSRAHPQLLSHMQEKWPLILQDVRENRIQTHAWLMNGQLVLATEDVAVLSFSSRIHRDAVMKADDRAVIESAFARALQRQIHILALVHSDWEAFEKMSQPTKEIQEAPKLADLAVQLFGRNKVEVHDGE